MKKISFFRIVLIIFILLILSIGIYFSFKYNLVPKKCYSAKDFGIKVVKSKVDANKNGIDDYKDIMLGARKDAENHPNYDPEYYDGGYPSETSGVCNDVVWRSLKNAGYDFKELIDEDIKNHPQDYPGLTNGKPDSNIDFRRVKNLSVFLEKYTTSLILDISEIDQFQQGDILIFKGNTDHVGIVSDKRNKDGIPWLIHNGGQPKREEDGIERQLLKSELIAHYRWDFKQ